MPGPNMRDVCTECPAGTYSNVSSGECTPCPAGTWQETAGETSCNKCDKHKFSFLEGQIGSYACLWCPEYLLHDKPGAASISQCAPCPDPYIWETNSQYRWCEPCPLGQQKNGEVCENCPIGKYRAGEDAPNCTSCPSGTTTASEGSTSPLQCVCDEETSAACCNRGREYNATSGQCVGCAIQEYQNQIGIHECIRCPESTVASASGEYCYCAEPVLLEGHCQPYSLDFPWGLRRITPEFYEWLHTTNRRFLQNFKNESNWFALLENNFTAFMQDVASNAQDCSEMEGGGEHYFGVIQRTGEEYILGIYCHPYDYYTCARDNNIQKPRDNSTITFTIVKNSTSECGTTTCAAGYVQDTQGFCVCSGVWQVREQQV